MPQLTQFKERTYEKYFGHQLARSTNLSYSPDLIDEFHLGFDEAFFIPIPSRTLRYRKLFIPWQLFRTGLRLSEVDSFVKDVGDALPPFRFNFFVQYKRPEYVSHHRGGEWKDWESSYYRYRITQHQQDEFARLHAAARGRAAVVYASPAFLTWEDLFEHVKNQRVISESNLASANRMSGHDRFTYTSAGSQGKVHSEAEDVNSPTFEEIMQSRFEQDGMALYEHTQKMAQAIEISMEEDEDGKRFMLAARGALLSSIGVDLEELNSSNFINAVSTIEAFSDIYDLSYYSVS